MNDNSKVLFSSLLLFADLSPCSLTLPVLDESTRIQSHCTYSIFPVCAFYPPRISPDEGRGGQENWPIITEFHKVCPGSKTLVSLWQMVMVQMQSSSTSQMHLRYIGQVQQA